MTSPAPGNADILKDLRARIRALDGGFGDPALRPVTPTGIDPLDRALPGGGIPRGALTEVVSTAEGSGALELVCAIAFRHQRILAERTGTPPPVALIDAAGDLYPPALLPRAASAGAVLLFRPGTPADCLWTFEQTLRVPALAAIVLTDFPAHPGASLPAEARRLQLAAETGGALAFLLRRSAGGARSGPEAAVRLAVTPCPTQERPRRFRVDLVRARGGLAASLSLLFESGHGPLPSPLPAEPSHRPARARHGA